MLKVWRKTWRPSWTLFLCRPIMTVLKNFYLNDTSTWLIRECTRFSGQMWIVFYALVFVYRTNMSDWIRIRRITFHHWHLHRPIIQSDRSACDPRKLLCLIFMYVHLSTKAIFFSYTASILGTKVRHRQWRRPLLHDQKVGRLFSIYFRYSYTGSKFKHTQNLSFRQVAYTRCDISWSANKMEFISF